MFNSSKLILIVLAALALAGCVSAPQVVTVTKTQTVVLDIPETFTKATPVPEPYSEAAYLAADWPTRAQLNAELAAKLYKSLSQANNDKSQILIWMTKEKQRVKAGNEQ